MEAFKTLVNIEVSGFFSGSNPNGVLAQISCKNFLNTLLFFKIILCYWSNNVTKTIRADS